ncbi:MAG: AIR synthase-related protein [Promethearchaeota archaeon]
MVLKKIAESIRSNKNIIEKIEINPIIQHIDNNSFKSTNIFSDIGEDSASIIDEDKFILITTDRIRTTFVEKFPFGAGFSSILVGVDDIYACGGTPLAASIIISVKDVKICNSLLDGICEGSKKFKVPIIRGHTNIHGKCYELSSTMLGEIKKENYLSAINANLNDSIILAVDFDGKVGKASKLYWDTVTFKSSEEILNRRKSMNLLAELHLANSSKDISNGGIFGTLLQLIKYSNVGADININNIAIPPKLLEAQYNLETYIKMYLTTSFVISAPKANCDKILEIFSTCGLEARVIGEIIKEKKLKINDGQKSTEIFKF